jgi:hypothetical protein
MEEIYVNIDSRYRDLSQYPNESKFKINLNSTYKNINKIKMTSIELPNLDYLSMIDPLKNNNYILLTFPTGQVKVVLPSPLLNSDLVKDDVNYQGKNYSFICDTINQSLVDIYNTNPTNPLYSELPYIKFYKYKDNINFTDNNTSTNPVDKDSDKYRTYNGISVYNKILIYYDYSNQTLPAFSTTFDNNIFNQIPNMSKNFTIDFIIQNTASKNIQYPSLGYYLGFRKNTYTCYLNTPLISEEYSNFMTENYIFIKINDWGYMDHFNNKMFAKILLNSNVGDVLLNEFNTKEYYIKQPINIQNISVELVDYLGNTISTGGKDFSFTLQLSQILNSDNKKNIEYNFLNKKTEK